MNFPQAPGAVPIFGHAVPLLRDPLGFLASLPAHGDLVEIRLGPFRATVACTAELTRQILLNDRVFDKGGPTFDRLREVAGYGLGTCPHQMHRRQRRLTQPAFHNDRLPGYARIMTEQVVANTEHWQHGQVVDVLASMYAITTRAAMGTMFSGTLSPTKLEELLHDSEVVTTGMYRRVLMAPPLDKLPIFGNRQYARCRNRLRRSISEIISQRRSVGNDQGDLLSMLIAARDTGIAADEQKFPKSGRLSDAEIRDQVITFFIAGMETTALALTWALYLLAGHPQIQQALQQEADAVLRGRAATFEDLPELKLTRRIVTETLRLYPPVWMLTRTTTEDTHLGGHALAAGSTVIYSPYVLHHDPEVFPEPQRFNPDRWTGQSNDRAHRDSFIPFAGGARKCIGETFATTEASLVLGTICARWHLDLAPGFHVTTRPTITLHPKAMRLRISRRTSSPVAT
ncbi:cytochrome P450 [Streptomyces sp. NRRL F-2664]|uniref:cytochrome P450 n=1 Tax=Streptomyces sp. NRRL F-2664 TaxID=1463842 RepID=UPI001F2123D7|nr:cytochrome P450 [Streptomyces sp. NRRL F-2664]